MQKLRLYHKTLVAQHCVMMAALIFLCAGLFFIGRQVVHTLSGIDEATADIHSSFEIINRPRTGTIAGLNQVIFGIDALSKHSNAILDHEEKQLTTLDKQEEILFDDLHTIANNSNNEILTLNTTTATLNTLLGNINKSAEKVPDTITSVNKVTKDVDDRVIDPSITRILNATTGTTEQLEVITTNTSKVTTHLEQVIDNPKPLTVKEKILATFNILWKIGMLAK